MWDFGEKRVVAIKIFLLRRSSVLFTGGKLEDHTVCLLQFSFRGPRGYTAACPITTRIGFNVLSNVVGYGVYYAKRRHNVMVPSGSATVRRCSK